MFKISDKPESLSWTEIPKNATIRFLDIKTVDFLWRSVEKVKAADHIIFITEDRMFELEETGANQYWALLFITEVDCGYKKGLQFYVALQSEGCTDIDMLPDNNGWLDDFAENEWYPADISAGLYHLKLDAPPDYNDLSYGVRVLKATRLYNYQPENKDKGI